MREVNQVQEKKYSKLAILSLFLPILIFPYFVGPFKFITPIAYSLSLTGLIFGITSLYLIKKNNLKGKGFAITGIILSTIFTHMLYGLSNSNLAH